VIFVGESIYSKNITTKRAAKRVRMYCINLLAGRILFISASP
jgi:hypothetical protein